MTTVLSTLGCLLFFTFVILVIFLVSAIRKVPENEKWIVSRLGQTSLKGPGTFFQIPLIDQVKKVPVGEQPTNIQDQICITKDKASVIIHMIVYSRVMDPVKYSSQISLHREDFVHLASSTLKETVSARFLDQVLSARDELGAEVSDKLNGEIGPNLGMKIEKVKIMDIAVSQEILASMSKTEFPAECPGCGAPVNSQAAKGSRQIKCEYCGYLIKL